MTEFFATKNRIAMNFTKLPFSKQKQIDEGPIRTIDSSSLARPFDPPKPVLIASLVFALIAAIIGGFIFLQIRLKNKK